VVAVSLVRAPIDQTGIIAGAVGAVLFEDGAGPAVWASMHPRKESIDGSFRSEREAGKSSCQLRLERAGHGSMLRLMSAMTSAAPTPSASARKFITSRCMSVGSRSARTSSTSAA